MSGIQNRPTPFKLPSFPLQLPTTPEFMVFVTQPAFCPPGGFGAVGHSGMEYLLCVGMVHCWQPRGSSQQGQLLRNLHSGRVDVVGSHRYQKIPEGTAD